MMEAAIAVGSLKVAYHLLIFGIKLDQVPAAVRRCIELVRTCHYDLEDLIKLRNESLPVLESKPDILERINTIIRNARAGVLEVARLVEKLRPKAHGGSTPPLGRLEWLSTDSREFDNQEPLISRQHSSVIAELNFLRQLALLAPLMDRSGASREADTRPMVAWENVALIDEMLGGGKTTCPSSGPSARPFIYNASVPDAQKVTNFSTKPAATESKTQSSSNGHGLSLLLDDLKFPPKQDLASTGTNETARQTILGTSEKRMNFDSTGLALLFDDLRLPPRHDGIPMPVHEPTQQAGPDIPPAEAFYATDSMTAPLQARNSFGGSNALGPNPHPQPTAPMPPARSWITEDGQRNRCDTGVSSPLANPLGNNFYLGANISIPNLQLQSASQPSMLTASGFRHSQQFQRETDATMPPDPSLRQHLQPQRSTPFLAHRLAPQPLTTIPQELIHRQDGVERLLSPPAVQIPTLSTAPTTTPYSIQNQAWQQTTPSRQLAYLPYTTNPTAGMSTISLPPTNTLTLAQRLPLNEPKLTPEIFRSSCRGIASEPSKEHLLYWNPAGWPPPKPPPKEGATPRPSITSESSYGRTPSEMQNESTASPNNKGVATYATVREHWEPQYLTRQPRGHWSEIYPGGEIPKADGTNILGAPSVSSGQYLDALSHIGHPGIAELPGVTFPPDPSELE